jgi:hypothetical protein
MIFGRFDDRVHQVHETRPPDKSARDREHSGAATQQP